MVRTTDPEDLALMAGGATRLAETATVALLARDELEIVDKRSFARRPGAVARSATEAALLDCAEPASWSRMRAAAIDSAASHDVRLTQLGLVIASEHRFLLRLAQAAPLMILTILLALPSGLDDGNGPTGPLAAITALLVLIRMAWFNRLTEDGIQVLANARGKHQGLRRAFVRDDAGLAVALFGPAVLTGSSLAGFLGAKKLADSGSGCGGGCAGGGCGGGCGDGCGGGCGG